MPVLITCLVGVPLAVSLLIAIVARWRWERNNPPTDPALMTMSQLLEWDAKQRREHARRELDARRKRLAEWNRLPERSE